MTEKKTKKGTRIFQLIINRRVDDAIAINLILLPLISKFKSKHMSKLERIINWIITIATGITVLLEYILSNIPKTSIILLFMSTCIFGQVSTRSYPFSDFKTKSGPYRSIMKNQKFNISEKDSSLFFGPSINFEVYSHELSSGITDFGVLPGIGYGIKYNPYNWKFMYLIGLDLFANVGIFKPNNNEPPSHFNIQVVPVISILGFFHVGIGYRWKLGLNGNDNKKTAIFVTGASIPLP